MDDSVFYSPPLYQLSYRELMMTCHIFNITISFKKVKWYKRMEQQLQTTYGTFLKCTTCYWLLALALALAMNVLLPIVLWISLLFVTSCHPGSFFLQNLKILGILEIYSSNTLLIIIIALAYPVITSNQCLVLRKCSTNLALLTQEGGRKVY